MAESLTDIAKKLNVAASTVSRAISDPDKVAPKTRQKILAYIEKVGYRPNLAARNLRMQRANTVGIVVNDLCDSLISSAANVMQNVASERGFFPVVLSTDDSSKKEAEIIESLLTHNICGLVIIPSNTTHEHFEKLKQIPVVELDRCTDLLINDEFRMDDRAAMQLAVKHLKALGCQHIAGIFGNIDRVSSFNSRYQSMPRSTSQLSTSSYFLKEVSAPKLQASARYLINCIIKSEGLGNSPESYTTKPTPTNKVTPEEGNDISLYDAIDKAYENSYTINHEPLLMGTLSPEEKNNSGSKLIKANPSHAPSLSSIYGAEVNSFYASLLPELLLECGSPLPEVIKPKSNKKPSATKNKTSKSKSVKTIAKDTDTFVHETSLEASRETPRIDGFIAANHTIAAGMLQAFRDNGLTPNEEIKIVVFDDPDWLDVLPYKIASISHPLSIAAEQAMQRLIDRVENKVNGNAEVHLIRPEILHT